MKPFLDDDTDDIVSRRPVFTDELKERIQEIVEVSGGTWDPFGTAHHSAIYALLRTVDRIACKLVDDEWEQFIDREGDDE